MFNSEEVKKLAGFLLALLVLALGLASLSFIFVGPSIDLDLFLSQLRGLTTLGLNMLPIFLCLLVFSLATNRIWLGFSLTSSLLLVGGLVNRAKIIYRNDPLNFSDLVLLKESLLMAKSYDLPLDLRALGLLGLLALISLGLWRYFDPRLARRTRLILGLALLVVFLPISRNLLLDPAIYGEAGDMDQVNELLDTDRIQAKGFIYPFVYSIREARPQVPEGYCGETCSKILASYEREDLKEEDKVHIISIMLEAYNDFSKFGLDFEKDPYDFFHRLQEESVHGELLTNVFAGGTINTERAFLTGYHWHPSYRQLTNSFVWYLNSQGYRTEAMHPITGSFYNRRNGNEYLGFQKFDHLDNKYHKYTEEGGFLRDGEFFDFILEGLEASIERDQPYFNFSVTYQNHGPYPSRPYKGPTYLKKDPAYGEDQYNIVNNYLMGLGETGQALEDLVDSLRDLDEPVVLVLFGDHNPWLGEDNSGYKALGIDLDLTRPEGFMNYYETPYIIWGNQKAREVRGTDLEGYRGKISPNYLMNQVFSELGYRGDEYNQALEEFKSRLPVIHQAFKMEDDDFTRKLSREGQELLRAYRLLEHHRKFNFSYSEELRKLGDI